MNGKDRFRQTVLDLVTTGALDAEQAAELLGEQRGEQGCTDDPEGEGGRRLTTLEIDGVPYVPASQGETSSIRIDGVYYVPAGQTPGSPDPGPVFRRKGIWIR